MAKVKGAQVLMGSLQNFYFDLGIFLEMISLKTVMLWYFSMLYMPRIVNSTAIPKCANPLEMGHFCPIYCCNKLYKYISGKEIKDGSSPFEYLS